MWQILFHELLLCVAGMILKCHAALSGRRLSKYVLTLSLPNATVVEFTVHCQTRLKSKFTSTVVSGLFLTLIWDATLCSLSQNVQGT